MFVTQYAQIVWQYYTHLLYFLCDFDEELVLKKCNIDIWLQAKFKFSSFALSQTPNRNIRFFYVTQLFLAPLVRLQ